MVIEPVATAWRRASSTYLAAESPYPRTSDAIWILVGPPTNFKALRGIAAALAGAGHLNERGATYSAKSIASMLS